MIGSFGFLNSVLDTITDHIVVIDKHGLIRYFNQSWARFGSENSCVVNSGWLDVNYLAVCDQSAAMGDDFGKLAGDGIRSVIDGCQEAFYLEYPCHSPCEKRWFMMRVTPLEYEGLRYFTICHQNITERKLAEEEVLNLARIDGLTGIPNRRTFDEFLDSEMRRCSRLNFPITLALLDIDHFKLLNDTYGHQAGDECLKTLGGVLEPFARRPSDICARYGGEEFSLVLGNTDIEESLSIVNRLIDSVHDLKFPNEKSPVKPIVTVSVGLAVLYPDKTPMQHDLINAADKSLYFAKENGRNQIACNVDR